MQTLILHEEEFTNYVFQKCNTPRGELFFSGNIHVKNERPPPFRNTKQGFLKGAKSDQSHIKSFNSKALLFLNVCAFIAEATLSSPELSCPVMRRSLTFIKAEGKNGLLALI